MPVLKQIEDVFARLKAKGANHGEIVAAIKAVVNSPLVGLLVGMTPNKADDAILETLKVLFPA